MKKILFVCLGNICRSPMEEFVFKDIVRKDGKERNFYIESAATSTEEVGSDMHYGTKEILDRYKIPYKKHTARQLKKEDYDKFDYIIGMDSGNIRGILRIVGEDNQNKVYKLLNFAKENRDIADPWYTGNFKKTYDDILKGCMALYNNIK